MQSKETFLVLDLETVPDLDAARQLFVDGEDLSDRTVRRRLGERYARDGQRPEDAFVKPVMQRIAAIGLLEAWADGDQVFANQSEALDRGRLSEAEMLRELDEAIDPRTRLVTYNGAAFDLPVIRYRALATATPMPNLLGRGSDTGRRNGEDFFYRYGTAHIDLADRLSSFGAGRMASLAEVLALLGKRAKDGVDGGDVEKLVEASDWRRIADYVRRDVEMTFELFKAYRAVTKPPERQEEDRYSSLARRGGPRVPRRDERDPPRDDDRRRGRAD